MQILQFLLSFFLKEYGIENFEPIIKLLGDNSFNIPKTIKSLSPETLAPIIKQFLSSSKNKKPSSNIEKEGFGISPIQGFTDNEILSCLNNYLENA